jgi:hypothetical protein
MKPSLDLKTRTRRINTIFCHSVRIKMNIVHFKPGGAREWLNTTFGPEYDGWALLGPATYGFKSEEDKMLFLLRWS